MPINNSKKSPYFENSMVKYLVYRGLLLVTEFNSKNIIAKQSILWNFFLNDLFFFFYKISYHLNLYDYTLGLAPTIYEYTIIEMLSLLFYNTIILINSGTLRNKTTLIDS